MRGKGGWRARGRGGGIWLLFKFLLCSLNPPFPIPPQPLAFPLPPSDLFPPLSLLFSFLVTPLLPSFFPSGKKEAYEKKILTGTAVEARERWREKERGEGRRRGLQLPV